MSYQKKTIEVTDVSCDQCGASPKGPAARKKWLAMTAFIDRSGEPDEGREKATGSGEFVFVDLCSKRCTSLFLWGRRTGKASATEEAK